MCPYRKFKKHGRKLICFVILSSSFWALFHFCRHISRTTYTQLITSEISSSNSTEIIRIMGTDKLPIALHSEYIIENRSLCSSSETLHLVVIVHTAPTHFDRRDFIRKTWMNPEYIGRYGETRLLFLLGRPLDINIQKYIGNESRVYGDLLQGDFMDSYHNITNKAVMAYKWLSEQCRNTRFVLKVDDDVVVNIFHLFQSLLPYLYGKSRTVVCRNDNKAEFFREPHAKQYVPRNFFPGQQACPEYCWGFFVLLSGDIIPLIYEAAKSTPFFWVDDVHVYGILLNRIPGCARLSLTESLLGSSPLGIVRTSIPTVCFLPLFKQSSYCKAIVAIGDLSTDLLLTYWKMVLDNNQITLQ